MSVHWLSNYLLSLCHESWLWRAEAHTWAECNAYYEAKIVKSALGWCLVSPNFLLYCNDADRKVPETEQSLKSFLFPLLENLPTEWMLLSCCLTVTLGFIVFCPCSLLTHTLSKPPLRWQSNPTIHSYGSGPGWCVLHLWPGCHCRSPHTMLSHAQCTCSDQWLGLIEGCQTK